MNVLVLSAHPDDETIGCGATVSRLSSEGAFVRLITFTDGFSSRRCGDDRRPQVGEAARILGIHEFVCGDFPDNMMDSIPLLNVCRFIEDNVGGNYPDLIFTHHPECLNIDHRKVFEATCTVFRPQNGEKQMIYSYEVPSSTSYNPVRSKPNSVYFDVSKFVDKKLLAMNVYSDEMREYPHSRSPQAIINAMKKCGNDVGLEFAERFCHIRSII